MTADPALRTGRPKADRETLRSNQVFPLTTPTPPTHLLRGLDLPHERRDVTADIKGLGANLGAHVRVWLRDETHGVWRNRYHKPGDL